MKVFISNKTQKDGYLCVPNINTLNVVVENGEADEIIVDNFLSGFSKDRIADILKAILAKVKLNGKIVIFQNDIEILSWQLTRGFINIDDFNNALFLDGPILSTSTIEELSGLLKDNNFQVTSKRIIGFVAAITGERNA